MPIDLDGIALIDTMLDAIIELRLMPDIWTDAEGKYLEKLHTSLLRLNHYWEDLDCAELGGMEIMALRNTLSSVVGYSELLSFELEEGKRSNTLPYLCCVQRLGKLILAKVDYMNRHLVKEY